MDTPHTPINIFINNIFTYEYIRMNIIFIRVIKKIIIYLIIQFSIILTTRIMRYKK
jgi:hypothetical protein